VTYICRGAKKKHSLTRSILFLNFFLFLICFLNRVFGRFVTRGVQNHDKKLKKSIWAHHKKCGFFFLRFLFNPSAVLLDFVLIAFLGVS
jgi:hypothetical protein